MSSLHYYNSMTCDQKNSIALFLDSVNDFLGSGYASKKEYSFLDDSPYEPSRKAQAVEKKIDTFEVASDSLQRIINEVYVCTNCPLHKTRKLPVSGEGVREPAVLVIGEAPGAEEDKAGRPFVGPAGRLLDKMLSSIDLSREKQCFITNVVKCRPPSNRDPSPDEISSCMPFFARQLALLKPKLILSLGRISTQWLLQTDESISSLRGQWKSYQGIPFLPTYHPSALLRNESWKRPAWEDLKMFKAKLQEL